MRRSFPVIILLMLLSAALPSLALASGPFEAQLGPDNPFSPPIDVDFLSTPTFADMDADGDFDVFIGSYSEGVRYFENVGTAQAPAFAERTAAENPLAALSGSTLMVALADLDGDGDLDAVSGQEDGSLAYYRNDGSPSDPNFSLQTGTSDPFAGITVSSISYVALADMNDDGDVDFFLGSGAGTVRFYRNEGTASDPSFVAGQLFFETLDNSARRPALADVDGDGDLDAIIGEGEFSRLRFFENVTTGNFPEFAYREFDDLSLIFTQNSDPAPAWVDIEADGDLDLFLGDFSGQVTFYENVGTAQSPQLEVRRGADNPLGGLTLAPNSRPTFSDYRGDGDFDAFIGQLDGRVQSFQNIGSPWAMRLTPFVANADPMQGLDVGSFSAPVWGDLNGDDKLDVISGGFAEGRAYLAYFTNTGTLAQADLGLVITDTPFATITDTSRLYPALADLDADGDLDLLVGTAADGVRYHRNIGTPNMPTFGVANTSLFGSLSLTHTALAVGDVDLDGDLDVVLGRGDGKLDYFENIGSPTVPNFERQLDVKNPFLTIDVGQNSAPALVDEDNDGDLDIFIGSAEGAISFYRNNSARPNIRLSKMVRPLFATPGDVLTYTLRLENLGNEAATALLLTDTLPSALGFETTLGTAQMVNVTGQQLVWGPHSLAASGSITLSYTARLSDTVSVGEAVINTAQFTLSNGRAGSDSAQFTVLDVQSQLYLPVVLR